jgi:Cof subfamily protein (haloacid dehalogenase superfamily)
MNDITQLTAKQPIQLIAVDIDGTLLNSQHLMSERVENTLKAAMAKGVKVVLATGKTYNSGEHIVQKLGLTTPGVYVQGTTIYSSAGVLQSQITLDPRIARQVITFADDRDYTVAIYSWRRILVRKLSDRIKDLASKYHEPVAEEVGPLQNVLDSVPVNKLLVVAPGDARRITALRWQLSMQIDRGARLLQAGIDDMLEILPPSASKGAGVKLLIKEMGIPAEAVLAMGDAENDIEMLGLAGLGVAVGNASQKVKDAANAVVASNDEDGVAEAVERFVLNTTSAAEPVAETTPS